MQETTITTEYIIEKTIKFLAKFIRKDISDYDENFFTKGIVNSLFAMQLVMFVEKEFEIKVQNDDLDLKNFCSVNAILRFVVSKLQR